MSSKTITLCMFYTSTGVDVSTYETRHDAHRGAIITMCGSLLEIADWDTRQSILDAILREDYVTALETFGAATGQTFEFDERVVLDTRHTDVQRAWGDSRQKHHERRAYERALALRDEAPASEPTRH